MGRFKLLLLLFALVPLFCYASPLSFYLQAEVGGAQMRAGKTETLTNPATPIAFNRYQDKRDSAWTAVGGFQGGASWTPWRYLMFELGAGLYQTSDYQGNGSQQQGGALHLFDYKYNLTVLRVMAIGRLYLLISPQQFFSSDPLSSLASYPVFAPFVSFGVGRAWVKAKNFKFQPLQGDTPPSAFQDYTSDNSATQFGGGLDLLLNPHTGIILSYHHVEAGDAKLGSGGVYNKQLQLGAIIFNELTLGIHYRF